MTTNKFFIAALVLTTFTACSDPIPALYQSGIKGDDPIQSRAEIPNDGPTECTSRGSCDDGDPCTEDRCQSGACVAVPIHSGACCISEILYAETFDDPSTSVNQETIHGELEWGVSHVRANSAPASLYFGDEKSGSYATGERVAASMKMPVLVLPTDRDASLEFQIFADIEPANEYDRFKVMANVVDGANAGHTVDLLTKSKLPTKAFKDFVSWKIDLGDLRGEKVQISFTFDSIDEMNNAYEGVFIDDIQVTLGCPELTSCVEDTECDDGNECTINLCSSEGCVSEDVCTDSGIDDPDTNEPGTEEPDTNEPGTEEPGTEEPGTEEPGTEEPGTEEPGTEEPGTEEPGTEEPGTEEPGTEEPGTEEPGTDIPGTDDPGTDDSGSDDENTPVDTPSENINPCELEDAPENCCLTKSDCDDGNPMTVDTCEGGNCVWTPNPDACEVDADCLDDEACTSETCVDGLCEFAGATDGFCCEDSVETLFDFDAGKLQGLFVTDNVGAGVFWSIDDGAFADGGYGLTCQNPLAGGYDVGERVKSSATTPPFDVPVGGITQLRLDLRKVTRANPNVDVFEVLVLRDGALVQLFSTKTLPEGGVSESFESIDVSLAAYAGQAIQLRFVFDSVNAPGVSLEGVTMDSLELVTACQ